MAPVIRIIARRSAGLVAIHRDGTVSKLTMRAGAVSGNYHERHWRSLDLTGVAGRVIDLTVNYDDSLIALCADGSVYEQHQAPGDRDGHYSWRKISDEG